MSADETFSFAYDAEAALTASSLLLQLSAAPSAPSVPARYRTLFVTTMQADLAEMEQALKARDVVLLARLLHRMRGALSVMHMKAWAARLAALEAALRGAGLNAGTRKETLALAMSLRDMLTEL